MPSDLSANRIQALKGAAWGIFAISIWASWMVFTRLDLGETGLTVYDITAIRFGSATIFLFPIIIRHGVVARSVGPVGTLLMVAGAGAPYTLLASTGLLFAPAGMAGALIPGVMPLFAMLLSFVVLGERASADRMVGLAFIPLGVLFIVGSTLLSHGGSVWIGQILFLSASVLWASYTVTLRRSGLKPLHGAALVAFWSAVLFIPVYALSPLPSGLMSASIKTTAFQVIFQGFHRHRKVDIPDIGDRVPRRGKLSRQPRVSWRAE